MHTRIPGGFVSPADAAEQSSKSGLDPIGHNIDSILAIYSREEQCVTRSQRMLERIIDSLGRPIYLGVIVLFCLVWILINVFLSASGLKPFDLPPFHWLQGIIGLAALLIMIRRADQAKPTC